MKHATMLVSLICSWIVLCSSASADIEYELIIIEPWDTSSTFPVSGVSGINNLNQVSGGATGSPPGPAGPFLWTLENGKVPIDLSGAINDQGVIAGEATIRWADGTLETLEYPFQGAADLNNANVVAGSTGTIGTCLGGDREAAVWDPIGGTTALEQDLGILAADQAWAINDQGELVGVRSSTGLCGDQKAFYLDLPSSTFIDLHLELVGTTSGGSRAFDINDAGFVVGEGPHEGTVKPFLWHPMSGFTFLPAIPGGILMDTHPRSINDGGTVVGAGIVDGLEWHGFVWDAVGGIHDLNDLVTGPLGFVIDGADQINDNGWIIGSGHYGTWSPERAVVLIPIGSSGQFRRGDGNADGVFDISDAILTLTVLFGGGAPGCQVALDANDDEQIDVADAVYVLAGLFSPGSPPPPPPFSDCGTDPTAGALTCDDFEPCP